MFEKMSSGLSYHLTRIIFLRILACIYLIAFTSIYLQWASLYSCSGIEPVFTHLQKVEQTHGHRQAISELPTLGWLHDYEWIGVDIDIWMEGLILVGMIISFLILLTGCDSFLLYLLLWMLYSSIQAVGQNFLSFQWDILLIETGFIAILLGSLWPRMTSITTPSNRITSKRTDSIHPSSSNSRFFPSFEFDTHSIGLFLLRFLLFRLMFASGAVKLLSNCRTWTTELSALEYHYATQCLPTPAAYLFHQLPAFIQRLSVAITIWIEIIGAFLLLVPTSIRFFSFIRRVGSILQISLQLLIIITGNYTFFNWLTIALCVTLFSDQDWYAFGQFIRPWRWCKRKREVIANTQPDSSTTNGAIELQPVQNKSQQSGSSKPGLKDSSSSNSSSPLVPPLSSASPSSSRPSLIIRLLNWFVVSLLKLSFLALLIWSFVQFYEIKYEAKSGTSTSAAHTIFSPWDQLPQLNTLSLKEIPYAIILYAHYFARPWTIRARYTPKQVQIWLDRYLLYIIQYGISMGLTTAIWSYVCIVRRACINFSQDNDQWRMDKRGIIRHLLSRFYWGVTFTVTMTKFLLVTFVGSLIFASSLVPFSHSLSHQVQAKLPYQQQVHQVYAHFASFHLTNSYGLFRSMTGVGGDRKVMISGEEHTVTMVERPELILEGSMDGDEWHELPFRYKPSSDFKRGPTYVAPHQPRLDWQMWFAALGQSPPPWLVHLVWKLLEGVGEEHQTGLVWDLMDINPKHFTPDRPPKYIRIEKKLIDFTRLPGADGGRLPAKERPKSTPANRLSIPTAWWREVSPSTSYLPAVDLANSSLQNYLATHHWVEVCSKMRSKMVRTKSQRQKEKLFEEIPPTSTNSNTGATSSVSATTNSKSSNSIQSKLFPSHPRFWELSYYFSLIEDYLPKSPTYGPYARNIKLLVKDARHHLNQFINHTWMSDDWLSWFQSPITRMFGLTILIVGLTDYLLR